MKNFQVILFTANILIVRCKYFSVVASAVLRVDKPYKVAVTSHDLNNDEFMEFKLGVIGFSQKGNFVEVSKNVRLNSSQTKTKKFEVRNEQIEMI